MFTFDFVYLDELWNTLFIKRRTYKSYREAYMFRNLELLNKPFPEVFTIQIHLIQPALESATKINPEAGTSNLPFKS